MKENLKKVSGLNPVKKIKSKKIRRLIYFVLIVILLIVISKIFFKGENNEFNYEEVNVERKNIDVVISGSGTIEPNNQYDITSLVQGEILQDYIEEGKIVNKDDLLYVIDSKDIQNTIDKAKLAVERAELAYQTTLETTNILATSNGIITNCNLRVGDTVMQGSKIADVLDSSNLRLVTSYNYIDTQNMYVGQSVDIIVENGFYNLTGVITKISSDSVVNESGIGVSYVEVSVTNPGSVSENDYAITRINGITSNNSNKFEFASKSTVYATGSGYIKSVNKLAGDYVTKGTLIATIGGESLDKQAQQSLLSLQDARLSLQNANDQLDNYNIKAPISGKVIQKNNKKGDILAATTSMSAIGTKTTPMAIIADMDVINFTMKVDELEISKVKVGQEVDITVDALEGRKYTGYVENINIVGEALNGITSYNVKIIVNEPEGLLPGMNVDADIKIVSVENVLSVPLSAVRKGNYVFVKDSDINYQDTDTDVPKGYRKIQVEIGENNSEYIQIISGLNEGDIVLVEKLKQSGVFDFGGGMMSMENEMHGGE